MKTFWWPRQEQMPCRNSPDRTRAQSAHNAGSISIYHSTYEITAGHLRPHPSSFDVFNVCLSRSGGSAT